MLILWRNVLQMISCELKIHFIRVFEQVYLTISSFNIFEVPIGDMISFS